MKDTSQTIPFNTNNIIACKRFMEAKIDGILIIMCRKTVSIDRKMDKITEFYSDDFCEGECCACDEPISDQEYCSCQDCCCECDEQEINASDR